MAKATIKIPDGTLIDIEGTADEIEHLLAFYANRAKQSAGTALKSASTKSKKNTTKTSKTPRSSRRTETDDKLDLAKIVNLVKDCDEAEAIETQILDRSGQVNRVLLPLYIVYEYLNNVIGLTSGDINKVTTELGIPIGTANASTTLSKTASKYVIGDSTRKRGQPVRYKLSRRGLQYFKSLLKDN
ncbi:MAG: hypothetical protein GKS00_10375 [Alphaproteobacteria bacterium]|nr:hypothetical protein [Alphaproteobacteria bacterium]